MKKQRFLFALFMAIVMMAMSPGRAWGQNYLVVDNELLDISVDNPITLDLTAGQKIWVELGTPNSGQATCTPSSIEHINGSNMEVSVTCFYDNPLRVGMSGKYKFVLSDVNVKEQEDPICEYVPNLVWNEELGMEEDMGGSDEIVGYNYTLMDASATLTITCLSAEEHQHVYNQEEKDLEGAQIKAETCTEKGTYYKSCTCGALGTETFEVGALGHFLVYSGNTVAVPATCTKNAQNYKTCDRCGYESDTETFEAYGTKFGHDWADAGDGVHHACQREGCEASGDHEWFDGKCMTCNYACQHPSGTSYGDYHQCNICYGTESHRFDSETGKCTACGEECEHEWNDFGHCFICEYACEHEEEGESTWNDGVCSNCRYECRHDDIISIVDISAPDIDYDDYVRYSDIDEVIQNIAFEIKCETCGKHLTQDDSDIARVTKTYFSGDNNPTCTEEGRYYFNAVITVYNSDGLCINSKQTNEEISGNINPLGHTPVTDEAVEATCVTSGSTEGSHCEVCGEVIEAQEEVPALGHSYGEEMSLGDDGYHHPVCTREECDVLSEDKYAKMFGEYKLVTGDANPTATIELTKVGNKYYTSLYTDFPYTLSSGGAATYIVTNAYENGLILLNDINDVPANCGVIIIGDASECTIEYAPGIYNSGTTDASPLLTGSETDVTRPAAKQYAFGLSDTGYLGFWHWPGMTIPAWSAYLDLGSETVNEAKGFRMVFEDGTTAIEQVPAKATTVEGRYDMMGRKVNKVKGLGIVDGKKVYVK